LERSAIQEHRPVVAKELARAGQEAAFGQAATPASSSGGELAVGVQGTTTVKLQGLPAEYTRPLLAELLDSQGFAGCYDFIYLPMDLRTRTGCGYALVNLSSHAQALRALQHFDGFASWGALGSAQACEAAWSQYCQGLDELVERYRNSPIMHSAVPDIYKPTMFRDGATAPFPEPTRRLRMPRLRKQSQKGGPALLCSSWPCLVRW
jgi:hypothetical protein